MATQKLKEKANRTSTGSTPHEQAKAEARARRGPVAATEDRVRVVTKKTSYVQIRRNMDDYLGIAGITSNYLDDVHRRWTVLGKMLKGGAL